MMMTGNVKRYLRQHYGTDDVHKLKGTLRVEAGSTADSRALRAGMTSSGKIRASRSGKPTAEDTVRRQLKQGVRGMAASASLPGLLRGGGGASSRQQTLSATQLPGLSAKGGTTTGKPLKLRENTFGASHYVAPKDERSREALRTVLFKKLMAKYSNKISPAHRAAEVIVAEIDAALETQTSVSAATVRAVEQAVRDAVKLDPELHFTQASRAFGSGGGALAAHAGQGSPKQSDAGADAAAAALEGFDVDAATPRQGGAPRESGRVSPDTAAMLADMQAPTLNRSYGAGQAHLVSGVSPKKLVGGKLVSQSDYMTRTGQSSTAAQEAQWLVIQRAKDLQAAEAELKSRSKRLGAAVATRDTLRAQMEAKAAAAAREKESARRYLAKVNADVEAHEQEKRAAAEAARGRSQVEASERLGQMQASRKRHEVLRHTEKAHERAVVARTQQEEEAAAAAVRERRLADRRGLRDFLHENESLRVAKKEAKAAQQREDKALMEQYAKLLEQQEAARQLDLHAREERLQGILSNMQETYESQEAARAAESARIAAVRAERDAAALDRELREKADRRAAQARLAADLTAQAAEKAQVAAAAKAEIRAELAAAKAEEAAVAQREAEEAAARRESRLAQRATLIAQMEAPRVSEEGMTPRTATLNAQTVAQAMQYLSQVDDAVVVEADTIKRKKGGGAKENLTLKRTTGAGGPSLLH